MSALKNRYLENLRWCPKKPKNKETKILAKYGRDKNTHAFSASLPSAREFLFFWFLFSLEITESFQDSENPLPT